MVHLVVVLHAQRWPRRGQKSLPKAGVLVLLRNPFATFLKNVVKQGHPATVTNAMQQS